MRLIDLGDAELEDGAGAVELSQRLLQLCERRPALQGEGVCVREKEGVCVCVRERVSVCERQGGCEGGRVCEREGEGGRGR